MNLTTELSRRTGAALVKGASMGLFGLWVIGCLFRHALHGMVPAWGSMGVVGVAALLVNGACLALLHAWRDGDANMHSVWICARNDVSASLAVPAAVDLRLPISSGSICPHSCS